ncbi:MAG: hypothetical protein SGJ17_13255 [Hyphomicrobiales bacterium]|nr:hypothetical protein [Hyphomicrobiales bacterium]
MTDLPENVDLKFLATIMLRMDARLDGMSKRFDLMEAGKGSGNALLKPMHIQPDIQDRLIELKAEVSNILRNLRANTGIVPRAPV